MVYPHYLAPIPSMAIVHFEADLEGGVTDLGFTLDKNTRLFTNSALSNETRCEFRTACSVKLWPIELSKADYLTGSEANYYAIKAPMPKAGIRLQLQTCNNIPFRSLDLNELVFYLDGTKEKSGIIYELLSAHIQAIVVQPKTALHQTPAWRHYLPLTALEMLGFSQEEALLPYRGNSFEGYRLLQEYFAFPERFFFFKVKALQASLCQLDEHDTLELIFLFKDKNELLQGDLNKENFVLNAVPAINLFSRRADRIHINNTVHEHLVIIDRTRAQDHEVYSIQEVTGFDVNLREQQVFRPFYNYRSGNQDGDAYYTWRRTPQLPAANQQAGRNYQASELYLSLVDSKAAPYSANLRQLGITALCTNKDIPIYSVYSKGKVSFKLDIMLPGKSVVSLKGPSQPLPAATEGEHAWRLINQLSLNYLSLLDDDQQKGAAALRALLRLYVGNSSASTRKQIEEGILSIKSTPIVRRLAGSGPIAFGRGLGIEVYCQESAFDGFSPLLLGSVLERFFAKYTSINSFTELTLSTVERGEVKQWPIRTGSSLLI